jgi:hypothetical protein
LAARCTSLLDASEVWVERERPRPRQLNIRPYVDSLAFSDGGLLASVWITQDGSARADEVAGAVGLAEPSTIERLELELWDDVSPEAAARTPKIEPRSRPLHRVLSAEPVAAPRETWGATANGPVVE